MKQATENQILQLTLESFNSEVAENSSPILIDFWAPWCGPCRMMKPILQEAAVKMVGRVRVAQVNIDQEPELANAFGIQSIPTCVLVEGRKAKAAFVGLMPADALVSQVLGKLSG